MSALLDAAGVTWLLRCKFRWFHEDRMSLSLFFSSHSFLCSNTDTKSSLVCSALSSDDYKRTECDISVSRLFPIFLGSRCWYQKHCLNKESFSIGILKFGLHKKSRKSVSKDFVSKKSGYWYWSKRMNDKKKKSTEKNIIDFDITACSWIRHWCPEQNFISKVSPTLYFLGITEFREKLLSPFVT